MQRFIVTLAAFLFFSVALSAQNTASPRSFPPDEAARKSIQEKLDKLNGQIAFLRKNSVHDPALADVEIFHKAVTWILRHNEFSYRDAVEWTQKVLETGLIRAGQVSQGETPWFQRVGQDTIRSFRSRIDGSLQPYAVSVPADYGRDPRKKWRIDIVLHGRDNTLTETKFLYQHDGMNVPPKWQDFVRLDVYGRGNNAYRWAGETDVFEALESFVAVERMLNRGQLLDLNRVVLRGFSMGGAGSWHIGLHYPSRWCLIGPGAGFTTTRGYVKNLPKQLPAYQEKCLRIYDAVDYAENAFDVPVVAYAGAKDPQLQAARNIEARLKTLGIKMQTLVAPDLEHKFPPEWQRKAEQAYAEYAGPGKGREDYPTKIRFVTYTLKYPLCSWVEILGLQRHYEETRVEAEKTEGGFAVKTANVRTLRLVLPETASAQEITTVIDGQELKVRPYQSGSGSLNVYLDRKEQRWQSVLPQALIVDRLRRPQKSVGMQGPIDDAFMTSFLCVRGSLKPWHTATQNHVDAELRRFQRDWNKYFRGELPIKNDIDVNEDDISSRHLILFGDPVSNTLIAQALEHLPLAWTKEAITFNGREYRTDAHVPVLVYPSPFNASRYVVLNSGHTFSAADLQGTNALLYPRLGDYAVLQLAPTDKDPFAVTVATAGLFDEFWAVPKD